MTSIDELNSSLFLACMTADESEALAALQAGAHVDYQNDHKISPLLVCVGGVGPPSLVEKLLMAGASVDMTDCVGWSPLIFVASSGQVPLFDILIHYGANINHRSSDEKDKGWTPRTRAAYRGHAALVDKLIRLKADLSALSDGKTALELASEQGHEEVIALLQREQRD